MRNYKGQFINEHEFKEVNFYLNNKEKFYFLGLLCSDGNLSGNKLSLSQSSLYGKLLIQRFKNFLSATNPIKKSKRYSNKHNYLYNIYLTINKKTIDYLNSVGLTENKTDTLKIDNSILENEFSFKWFLRGFIDGDGSVFITKRIKKVVRKNGDIYEYLESYMVISFCTNSLLAEDLNNTIYKFTKQFGKIRIRDNNHSEIIFRYGKSKIFGKWLYEDYRPLEWRKSKKCREYLIEKNLL